MMKFPNSTQFATCALAFVLAGLLGWKTAPTGNRKSETPDKPVRQVAGERRAGPRDAASREVALRMKAIRNAGTPEERIRASVALAMAIPPAEFAAWAEGDRFDFREGPELNIFRMALFERWIVENPESLIGFCMKYDWGQAQRGVGQLLNEQPELVLEYFRKNPNDKFELGKLAILAGSDPALALSRLREMSERGLSAKGGNSAGQLFRELSKKSPELLEAALEGLSPLLRNQAEIALSGQRLSDDFPTQIRSLWDRPDGWKIFSENLSNNRDLGSKLLGEIENMPASWKNSLADFPYYAVTGKSVRQWLELDLEGMGFSKSGTDSIRQRAANEYVNTDPAFVVGNLDSFKFDAREKKEIFRIAFTKLKGNPEEAEKLISSLGSEADKASAREQLDLVTAAMIPKRDLKPADYLKTLTAPGQSRNASYSFMHAAKDWSTEEIAEYQGAFDKMGTTEKQNAAKMIASSMSFSMSNELTGDAVRFLVNNPPGKEKGDPMYFDDNPHAAAAQYAMQLASKDLSSAAKWINTLPSGDAKKWAQRNVAADLIQYDPAAVNQWVKTLPAAERADVEGYLKGKE